MLNVLAFFLLVLDLGVRLKKNVERVLPVVLLALMLLLTGLAMGGALLWIDAVSIAVLVLLVLARCADFFTGRVSPGQYLRDVVRYGLTPGLVCLLGLAFYFWIASEPMTVWWRDDLAHWGLQVKSLWFFNGLVDGSRHLNIRYGNYPPGVEVLQWFALHVQGEWNERTLYFMLFFTYAVFLLPLFKKLTWKKAYLLPLVFVFCIAFPTWGNVLSYLFLGIDTTLALCFGYVLTLVWSHRRGDLPNLLAIMLGMCGLFLIKQIGILLAAMALVLFLTRKAEKGSLTFTLLIPFAVAGIWSLYCRQMGLTGYNTTGIGTEILSMFQGNYLPPENAGGILPALWNALTTRYTGEMTFGSLPPLALPPLFWLIFLPLIPLMLVWVKACPRREMRVASIYIASSNLFFTGVLYLSFFTTFYYETSVYTYAQQANMVLLIERYLAPILMGNAMLAFSLVLNAPGEQQSRARNPLTLATAGVMALLFALTTNWAVMAEVLIPDRYYQNDRSIGSEATVRDQESWGSALDDIQNARVLIDLDSTSDYPKELCYAFAPAKFFLSTPENTESTDALQAYLIENSITQLICLEDDSALSQAAAPLAGEDGFYSQTLYDVTVDQGAVTLTENVG